MRCVVRACLAILVSSTISLAGLRAGALTRSGASASVVVGGLVAYVFGRKGTALLGLFFTSGSALSRLPAARKQERGKTARTERQVLANGGVAAVAAIGTKERHEDRWTALFVGSLAAATSDTWATELGLQYGARPRYMISGKPVQAGLSGGVTPVGTLASVGGALAIAALAGAIYRRPRLVPIGLAGGMVGSIVDSILGELAQRKQRSLTTGEIIEARRDTDGPVSLVSGLTWVDNDLVNLACTSCGGVVSYALWTLTSERSRDSTCAVDPTTPRAASN